MAPLLLLRWSRAPCMTTSVACLPAMSVPIPTQPHLPMQLPLHQHTTRCLSTPTMWTQWQGGITAHFTRSQRWWGQACWDFHSTSFCCWVCVCFGDGNCEFHCMHALVWHARVGIVHILCLKTHASPYDHDITMPSPSSPQCVSVVGMGSWGDKPCCCLSCILLHQLPARRTASL